MSRRTSSVDVFVDGRVVLHDQYGKSHVLAHGRTDSAATIPAGERRIAELMDEVAAVQKSMEAPK